MSCDDPKQFSLNEVLSGDSVKKIPVTKNSSKRPMWNGKILRLKTFCFPPQCIFALHSYPIFAVYS